ncbi:MAG: serine/threonine protein kinase [Burkholderiales bacterium PBB1]|nr:MAG: serine/threonine protein kinase [Burkholderiales bacterium PBB1]
MPDPMTTLTVDDGNHLRLVLVNHRDALDQARTQVLRWLERHVPTAKLVFSVELILEETLMNVIWHAHPDHAEHLIRLEMDVDAADVVMRFEDDGVPFDPLQAPAPVAPRSIDDAVPGGLGLLLVRRCARDVTYQRLDGMNRLTVRVARH